jgi:taurine--2-oxoglutarate transaminase
MASVSLDQVVSLTAVNTFGTWRFQQNWKPLHIVDAEGCWFTDASGKKYLDFSSQLMCSTLGHKNRAVIESIKKQAEELAYIAPSFATTVRAELSQLLLEVLPKGLTKFFFTTSGTDGNEAAFKIAKMVTGKSKIIARYRSYHGATMGAIAATGDVRRIPMEPSGKIPGVIFAPEANCYKCPLGHAYPDCNVACVEYIDHMVRNEGDVAAVLVEPIVGTNGVLIPPDEYMPRLREICTKNDVLLIADEVMTGWGRTGAWFAVDHWKVVPDILVTAKGLTGAYAPLGLCATTEKVASYFDDHFFAHGHTYEAHPLMLAPAVAAINELKRMNLIERSKTMGKVLDEKLNALKTGHPSIGDVRVKGLFGAVELVRDRETKEPFNTGREKLEGKPLIVDKVSAEMMKHGVFLLSWMSHFVVAPPLTVTEQELEIGVRALDEALSIADAALSPA